MSANVFKINGRAVRLPVVASDPSSPENGMMWYNSTTHQFKKYENGSTSVVASPEASAVTYNNSSSGLTATNVQSAIDEVESRVDDLEDLDPMEYKGTWNANTNTPTLADGVGDNGDVYHVSVAGTVDLGSGNITFHVGDKVVYNGSVWEKWDLTDAVSSVNGETGTVVLDSSDLNHTQADTADWTVSSGSSIAAHLDELADRVTVAEGDIAGKLSAVQDDTSPTLGGNLSTGTRVIIHGSEGLKKGTSATDFWEEQYIHSSTLTASSTNAVLSALTFAHASFEGVMIDYKIKEATTNRVRIGQLLISTNGTDTSIVDTFTETGDVGVTWNLNISGADVQVRYTTTANDKTMRAVVKRIKA